MLSSCKIYKFLGRHSEEWGRLRGSEGRSEGRLVESGGNSASLVPPSEVSRALSLLLLGHSASSCQQQVKLKLFYQFPTDLSRAISQNIVI